MSDFGRNDPRQMPVHFFYRALRIDYRTAVRADVERQNCSICPRYWYVEATFSCENCAVEFTFSAAEQKAWYEDYGFWIDSLPKRCLACRHKLRELKSVRQEYDQTVAQVLQTGDLEAMKHLARVIDQLYEIGGELPPRINQNRRRLANQISRADRGAV
jgi:Probable zinc-ribbon domain